MKGNILIYTKNNYKVNEFVKNNESLKGHEGKDSRNEIKQFLIIPFAMPYCANEPTGNENGPICVHKDVNFFV